MNSRVASWLKSGNFFTLLTCRVQLVESVIFSSGWCPSNHPIQQFWNNTNNNSHSAQHCKQRHTTSKSSFYYLANWVNMSFHQDLTFNPTWHGGGGAPALVISCHFRHFATLSHFRLVSILSTQLRTILVCVYPESSSSTFNSKKPAAKWFK